MDAPRFLTTPLLHFPSLNHYYPPYHYHLLTILDSPHTPFQKVHPFFIKSYQQILKNEAQNSITSISYILFTDFCWKIGE